MPGKTSGNPASQVTQWIEMPVPTEEPTHYGEPPSVSRVPKGLKKKSSPPPEFTVESHVRTPEDLEQEIRISIDQNFGRARTPKQWNAEVKKGLAHRDPRYRTRVLALLEGRFFRDFASLEPSVLDLLELVQILHEGGLFFRSQIAPFVRNIARRAADGVINWKIAELKFFNGYTSNRSSKIQYLSYDVNLRLAVMMEILRCLPLSEFPRIPEMVKREFSIALNLSPSPTVLRILLTAREELLGNLAANTQLASLKEELLLMVIEHPRFDRYQKGFEKSYFAQEERVPGMRNTEQSSLKEIIHGEFGSYLETLPPSHELIRKLRSLVFPEVVMAEMGGALSSALKKSIVRALEADFEARGIAVGLADEPILLLNLARELKNIEKLRICEKVLPTGITCPGFTGMGDLQGVVEEEDCQTTGCFGFFSKPVKRQFTPPHCPVCNQAY